MKLRKIKSYIQRPADRSRQIPNIGAQGLGLPKGLAAILGNARTFKTRLPPLKNLVYQNWLLFRRQTTYFNRHSLVLNWANMARIQNALSSVTERFQGFEQLRAVYCVQRWQAKGRLSDSVHWDLWPVNFAFEKTLTFRFLEYKKNLEACGYRRLDGGNRLSARDLN